MQRSSARLKLPWWLWLLSFLAGSLLGAAALSYTPEGRINLLWVWLLWAGLPFLGSLIALLALVRPPARPWVTRFQHSLSSYWQPQPHQLWWLLSQLNALWVVFALGLLVIFLLLLLFSDLAFGWSSTLLTDGERLARWIATLSLPWQAFWPQAVPHLELIEQTRFARIESSDTSFALASRWWPFLMASLLFYNLLPRLLLTGLCRWRASSLQARKLNIHSTQSTAANPGTSAPLNQEETAQWQDAHCIYWQTYPPTEQAETCLSLGLGNWQEEEKAWTAWLEKPPQKLIWKVTARQTPLAELADKIHHARKLGTRQALQLQTTSTDQRHLASWQAFARKHQLVWLEPEA
ncbi:DUF2868 domain-containing protein [Marinospirillum sp.]|uniref:DUF2868 domain-containing protein n=1 Tax=Marinospirillum sp. TaxID=2183934 RepID=UPI00384D2CCB